MIPTGASPTSEHLTPPPAYLALGRTAKVRQRKYREQCDAYLRRAGLLDDAPEIEVEARDPSAASEVDRSRGWGCAESPPPRAG